MIEDNTETEEDQDDVVTQMIIYKNKMQLLPRNHQKVMIIQWIAS
jgi:hypothetical protein